MSRLLSIAALALAATLPTVVQAADFTFAGGSGTTATASFGSSGLAVNVQGPSHGGTLDVTYNSNGLGVSTGFLDATGIGNGESLTFTFSQAVNLLNLKLAEWDLADHATLTWGSNTLNLTGSGVISTQTLSLSGVTGTSFTLTGTSLLTTFKLNGVTATPAVPEPATYALMGLGLAGLAAARRLRKPQA